MVNNDFRYSFAIISQSPWAKLLPSDQGERSKVHVFYRDKMEQHPYKNIVSSCKLIL